MGEHVFMNFLGISEITGDQFLLGKSKSSLCISPGVGGDRKEQHSGS